MDCARVVFSGHAIARMFERGMIGMTCWRSSQRAIADYPEDRPYESELLLGFANARPLHVVVALDRENARCIVITVYEPNSGQWKLHFRTRKPE
jgi:hypothetical protein